MSEHPQPASRTAADDDFDVGEFSKELQMIVSFAILDLDVARDGSPAAA